MTSKDIQTMLKILEAKNITPRDGWVTAPCVFAKWTHQRKSDSHPSFGISTGPTSSYHCFACSRKGRLLILPQVLKDLDPKGDYDALDKFIKTKDLIFNVGEEPVRKKVLTPIPERILKTYKELENAIGPISTKSIQQWGLRFDELEYRLLFQIRDNNKRLVGIRGRYLGLEKNILRYRSYSELNPSGDAKAHGVWYGQQFPLTKKALFLVEGERDAILLKQAGVSNVWASMGASISKKQIETLRSVKNEIVCYFDDDKAGHIAKDYVKKSLKGYTVVRSIQHYFGCKDPAQAVEDKVIHHIIRYENVL